MKRFLQISTTFAVIGTIAAIICLPNFGLPTPRAYQNVSEGKLRRFALALRSYTTDGESPPNTLSILFPDYIDRADFFFIEKENLRVPIRPVVEKPSLRTVHEVRFRIDCFSHYRLITPNEDTLLIYEQPGIWGDGTYAYLKLEKRGNHWEHTESARLSPLESKRFQSETIEAFATSGVIR